MHPQQRHREIRRAAEARVVPSPLRRCRLCLCLCRVSCMRNTGTREPRASERECVYEEERDRERQPARRRLRETCRHKSQNRTVCRFMYPHHSIEHRSPPHSHTSRVASRGVRCRGAPTRPIALATCDRGSGREPVSRSVSRSRRRAYAAPAGTDRRTENKRVHAPHKVQSR